jgi:gamma-tubulin complex component 4
MIHEIIFLLIGYKGNFFELNSDETSYQLLEDINIFNEGERARLNKLGQLSFNYCKVKEFSYSKESIGGGGGGFYLNGFKASLKDILTTYTNLVCELENEILLDYNIDGGQPSLSYIMSRLSDYFLLFTKLNELIQELETILDNENPNEAIGCELINWVYELYLKNVNTIKSNFELILGELVKIFFNQLADWLRNGKLFDPEFEFFLVPSNLEKSRELGYFNINSNNTKYEIIWERMPYFINENISNSLLFIGKAINILTNSKEPLNLDFDSVLSYSKSCSINTSRLERTIYELRIESSKILYKKLFNIKSIVNKNDEVNRNLTDYIEQFKNFYLLQYGEYYDNLLGNLHGFLSARRSKFSEVQFEGFVRESDLNYLKIKSSEGTRAESSFLLDGLRFKLASSHDKNSTPSEAQKMPWNQLLPPNEIKLNYPIEYPLDLILEPKDLELYNTLFNYLIWIRKLIYQLELFDIKKLSSEYKSKTLVHTRWLILHTVKAIWAYLQVIYILIFCNFIN